MVTLLIISIIVLLAGLWFWKHGYELFLSEQELNKTIEEENDKLEVRNSELTTTMQHLDERIKQLTLDMNSKLNELNKITDNLENMKHTINEAFCEYANVLEANYHESEAEYDELIEDLEAAYDERQDELAEMLDNERMELDKISRVRAAAIQAQIKEKEIKEQSAFYCLNISKLDLDDIEVLERIKPKLHQPRILSMLIWSTYYQKPMTSLCNNILTKDTVCGIYKITNQTNDMCYIGQSVDIAKRWKDHAKCGLGIDTPASNKLYKAMQEDGLHNFSWELLQACDRDELDEREKYYIELYQSKEYGYNSTAGNK